MKKLYKTIYGALIVTGLLLLFGCMTSAPEDPNYVNDYQQALQLEAIDLEQNGISSDEVGKRFATVMDSFKSPDIVEKVNAIFAEEVYFNDTWHTHKTSTVLGEYLKRTGEKVHEIKVNVDDVVISKTNAYVRWNMMYIIDEGDEPLNSVGMTHLRFNEQKQIITYQDYWDGIEGFYRTLPIIGGLLNAIRNRLG